MILFPILLASLLVGEDSTLVTMPESVHLTHRFDHARVLFLNRSGDRWHVPTQQPAVSVRDPKVAKWDGSEVVPVGDGKTELVIKSQSRELTVPIVVSGSQGTPDWSFRNHVQSVLAKTGCNSGACHGAAAGKKGFKLSLRGFDAENDHVVLTQLAQGRRINLADPDQSLILQKPIGELAHGGGKRFEPDSLEYEVIADWIAAGCPQPSTKDPQIVKLEILPPNLVMSKGQTQPLVVKAHFSDGKVEDVTRWAKYESASGDVLGIDTQGNISAIGYGEGAVTAWYLNKIAMTTVTSPFPRSASTAPANGGKLKPRNFIDELVEQKLTTLGVPSSPICTDEEFIRRVYLDTIGVLPKPEDTRQFLASTDHAKRDRLIDRLLASNEFIDYWSYKWSDLLLVNSEKLEKPAMWSYYHWIRGHVAANTPWDQFTRELVTAQGSTLKNGSTNFYVLHQDPRILTETISLTFLGLSINCARCHNHPLEKWTNEQYYGMANLVSRVRIKSEDGAGNFTVYTVPFGELDQPLTGKPMPPQPLDGTSVPFDDPNDRRVALADWIANPANPYFSKAIVNRVWANFMSVGLVETVDDLRLTNPPSNPELLEALARDLQKNKFDLKSLMRTVLQSNTYQRSSNVVPGNELDKRYFSHYYPKRLMAEVMLDAISSVIEVPSGFANYPPDWRSLQLPDSKVPSYFLQRFGRPERDITCECERTREPSVVQVLHLSNGDVVNKKLSAPGNRIEKMLKAKMTPDAILTQVFVHALSRQPTAKELAEFQRTWNETPENDRRALVEDICWSVLNSKEFLFNH